MGASLQLFLLVCSIMHIEAQNKFSEEVVAEQRLYQDLMTGYNKHIRPIQNTTQPIHVEFGISLQQLIDLDEKHESIEIVAWLNVEWKDAFLTWRQEDYADISSMRPPMDKIWKPDIMLYNGMSVPGVSSDDTVHPVVYSDGTVNWVPPVNLKATCSMNVINFPIDIQTCIFKFGSWTYHGGKINVTSRSKMVDLSNYMAHHSWQLLNTTAATNVAIYECCPEPYMDVTFTVEFQRKMSFFSWWLIKPFVALALFLPFVFVFPREVKSVVATGVLISMSVMLSMVGGELPLVRGSVPSIVFHYFGLYCFVLLALLLSGLSNTLLVRGQQGQPVPKHVKTIILDILGRAVCVNSKPYSMLASPVTISSVDTHNSGMSESDNHQILPPGSPTVIHPNEWQLVSKVFDRFCLIGYLIFMILFSIITMAKYG